MSDRIILGPAAKLAERLNEEINRGNESGAFAIALILAASKDFLDIVLIAALVGFVPVVGQAPGLFLSGFLTYFLWGKGWFLSARIKIAWWTAGFFIDNLPGINLLPMQTLTVLYAWRIVRKRKESAETKLDTIEKLSIEEITNLNNNIALLDEAD